MREELNKKLVYLFAFVSVPFQILNSIVHPCLKLLAFRVSYVSGVLVFGVSNLKYLGTPNASA